MGRLIALLKRHRERLWRVSLATALTMACLGLFGLAMAHVIPLPERLDERDSRLITYRDGHPAHLMLSPDDKWRVGMPITQIDPHFIDSLIILEDQRFWSHPGVDAIAIGRATLSNIQHGEVVSGASTITMQLVRVLEPRPRTLGSKCVEALRAMQLELRMSKAEILANYLRFAPYGRNIEGIDAASMAYFGHRADALSNAEIATLLAVPQAPNSRYPNPKNAERLELGRALVARELLATGGLDTHAGERTLTQQQAFEALMREEVPGALLPFPREIPHLAQWIVRERPDKDLIHTSIDRHMQHNLERMVEERRTELNAQGIYNGAVVVANHRTREIMSVVGNLEFDGAKAGQMPAFALPRSTGSLLKPLITALAMDQGIAHPEQLIRDVPMTRRRWKPENFSGKYNGLVTLADALTRSLNIPFILLIEKLGPPRLLGKLGELRFAHLNPTPGHYGLGIAVGGVEATPMEVTGLYATLANHGAYRPLSWELTHEEDQPTTPLWSEGAGWLVSQVLARRERPDLPWRADLPQENWTIHWKTGTSNKHRDAWSVGYGGDLTVTVWLGNLSNASSESLVGARTASPLMFDVMEAMLPPKLEEEPAPVDALTQVEVCQYSGHLATPACEARHTVDAPVSGVPTAPCPYHISVEVLADTGELTRKACQRGRDVVARQVLTFDAEVLPYLSAQDSDVSQLPPWAPGCAPQSAAVAPELLRPERGQRFLLIPGIPADRQRIPFQAASATRNTALNWFLDGEFLGSTRSREELWWVPVVGEHELIVMDDTGRAATRPVVVERRQPGM